ncbi:MAG: hypothetical protein ABUT20_37260, partial [Bacteroidota bacterium]
MIVYVNTISYRLSYIADFIGKEIGGDNFFKLTSDPVVYKNSSAPKINYSDVQIDPGEFWLLPHSLLSRQTIEKQEINCFEVNGYKAFFKTGGNFPFDIFAASFYLLSRYEEYLPHKKDMYGRYAHENSLAFRENFLHLPLINIWINDFRNSLLAKFPGYSIPSHETKMPFLPTYDIDQAYSYKHKPFWKNVNGFARSLIKGDIDAVKERWNVLKGKEKDPFDTYQWMDELNRKYKLNPFYFFIVADQPGEYDKNISPAKDEMKDLITHHHSQYHIGIHPSWQSGDDVSLIEKEKKTLQEITGDKINRSRQHYIRFTLPETFRCLINAGIKHEFSMGYGSINGFRASLASEFYWFDLEKNEPTQLLLYPFCYMDANSFYEQHYSPQQAYEEMMHYYKTVKSVNGTMMS